jgi:hypothetical protein
MPADVADGEHWRRLAAEAFAEAEAMTDPDARRIMLFIAEGYRRLAESAEAREERQD